MTPEKAAFTRTGGKSRDGMSIYAECFRKDAAALDALTVDPFKKIKARLRNAADVMDRHAERRDAAGALADEVTHVLSKGEFGKQSRRRLKSALKTYRDAT